MDKWYCHGSAYDDITVDNDLAMGIIGDLLLRKYISS